MSVLCSWEELGFGPGSVPSAEQLARAAAGYHHHQQPPQEQQQQPGPAAGAAVDESWMDEAASLAALPLPQSAAELQVGGAPRSLASLGLNVLHPSSVCCWTPLLACVLISLQARKIQYQMFLVDDAVLQAVPEFAVRAHVCPQVRLVEGGDPRVGGGGGLGPMLLGSRAACAMPYDMVGIADSVDRMIAMMQRQGAGGHGDEGEEESDDGEGSAQEGEEEGEQEGRGKGRGSVRLPFGSKGAGAAVGGVVGGGSGGGGGSGEVEGEGLAWGAGVEGEGEEAAVAGTVAEVQMLLGMGEADGAFEL